VDGAFVVAILLYRQDYGRKADCFASKPGDSLEGKEVVCVIGERFVLVGISWLLFSMVRRGSRSWRSVCLPTITNFPERFLIVTSGGAAIFAVDLE